MSIFSSESWSCACAEDTDLWDYVSAASSVDWERKDRSAILEGFDLTDLMYVDDPTEPDDISESDAESLTEDYGGLKEMVRNIVKSNQIANQCCV